MWELEAEAKKRQDKVDRTTRKPWDAPKRHESADPNSGNPRWIYGPKPEGLKMQPGPQQWPLPNQP